MTKGNLNTGVETMTIKKNLQRIAWVCLAIVISVFCFWLSNPFAAANPGKDRGCFSGISHIQKRFQLLENRFALNADQLAAREALIHRHKGEIEALIKKANAAGTNRKTLKREMRGLIENYNREFLGILTPEQQIQFNELRTKSRVYPKYHSKSRQTQLRTKDRIWI